MADTSNPDEHGTPVARRSSYRRVLGNRPFLMLWIAQLVSQSGDFIFDVAVVWLVYSVTGSILNVGLVVAVSLLPGVVVGPVAGVYTDRINRKRLFLAANLFQAAITVAIAVLYGTGRFDFSVLLVMIFLLNAGAQFVRPAVFALMPKLVSVDDLPSANALFALSSQLNQLAGYGIGGAVVYLVGPTIPIYYDALTFVFAFAIVTSMSSSYGEVRAAAAVIASSFRRDFKEGIDYIRSSRLMLELVVVAVVVNFLATVAGALFAPYAATTIRGNVSTYGFLLAASSLGAVVGSIMASRLNLRKQLGRVVFGGIVGLGLLVLAMGLVSSPVMAILLSGGLGFLGAAINLPISVLIQTKTPGELLGRTVTALTALVTLATPISAALSGGLANSISVAVTFQVFGLLTALASIAFFFSFRTLRQASY